MFCGIITDRTKLALFLVRVLLGVIFIAHGSQKVLGWFGGPGLAGFAQWSAQTLHVPVYLSYAASFFELIGGLFLFLGIATELGALLVMPVMLGAIWLVHLPHGFFAQNGGFEYPLCLLVSAIAIFIGGPGKWYLWCPCRLLGCKCGKGCPC